MQLWLPELYRTYIDSDDVNILMTCGLPITRYLFIFHNCSPYTSLNHTILTPTYLSITFFFVTVKFSLLGLLIIVQVEQ